jgi:hypothetical protein
VPEKGFEPVRSTTHPRLEIFPLAKANRPLLVAFGLRGTGRTCLPPAPVAVRLFRPPPIRRGLPLGKGPSQNCPREPGPAHAVGFGRGWARRGDRPIASADRSLQSARRAHNAWWQAHPRTRRNPLGPAPPTSSLRPHLLRTLGPLHAHRLAHQGQPFLSSSRGTHNSPLARPLSRIGHVL